VTDLVHGLKAQGKQLTEDQIAYILHETLQVNLFDSNFKIIFLVNSLIKYYLILIIYNKVIDYVYFVS